MAKNAQDYNRLVGSEFVFVNLKSRNLLSLLLSFYFQRWNYWYRVFFTFYFYISSHLTDFTNPEPWPIVSYLRPWKPSVYFARLCCTSSTKRTLNEPSSLAWIKSFTPYIRGQIASLSSRSCCLSLPTAVFSLQHKVVINVKGKQGFL